MRPDFLVIGAFKAGTSSLQHYLAQHPGIFMSSIKEPNFLAYSGTEDDSTRTDNVFPVKTLQAYEALFSPSFPEQLRGEISPYYLHSPVAPKRIRDVVPNAKLIVSLRNPVSRAYSHYLMQFRAGLLSQLPHIAFKEGGFWRDASLYFDALSFYLSEFPREQLMIVPYEGLVDDGSRLINDLYRWLGLPEISDLDTSYIHNPGGLPKFPRLHRLTELARSQRLVQSYIPVPLRKFIARFRNANLRAAPELPIAEKVTWLQYYRDDILRTSELLHMDLSAWLEVD